MPTMLISLLAGLLFGGGLVVSQMINPAKVLAFLDLFGNWDPSLAFVMAAAVGVSAVGHMIVRRRAAPVFGAKFHLPPRRAVDGRLVFGAAVFGVGWGLAGFCPGPALTGLPMGMWQIFLFVAAMVAGMALYRFVPAPKTA